MDAGANRIIVAGFEPFGGRTRNRSLEIVRRLEGHPGIATAVLPVDFSRLEAAITGFAERRPCALLMIGESSRSGVDVEQVGLNLIDTDRPDNAGHTLQSQPIHPGAPLALQANWDAHALAGRLKAAGLPAAVSFHAGTYACNAGLYLALRHFPPEVPVGFMHVPKWRWPRGVRLAQLVCAAELCVEALLAKAHNAGRKNQ